MHRRLHIQRSKQLLDIAPIRTGRQTLEGVNPGPLNTIGKMGSGPLSLAAVAKKRPEPHGDIVHSDATPAARAPASQVGVNITDLHICEVAFENTVPA